jgi:hypothetical protein
MEKQAQDLKHKDDEIARSKEENKRLNTRLTQLSAQLKTPKPTSTAEMAALYRINKEHIDKLNNQKIEVNNLLTQNARLKEILKDAGISYKATREEDQGESKKKIASHESRKASWKEESRRHHRGDPSQHTDIDETGTSSTLAVSMVENGSRTPSDTSGKRGVYSSFATCHKGKGTRADPRSHWERSINDKNVGLPSSPKKGVYIPI